jgi:hypothetical protein
MLLVALIVIGGFIKVINIFAEHFRERRNEKLLKDWDKDHNIDKKLDDICIKHHDGLPYDPF